MAFVRFILRFGARIDWNSMGAKSDLKPTVARPVRICATGTNNRKGTMGYAQRQSLPARRRYWLVRLRLRQMYR